MKKIIVALFVIIVCVCFVACGESGGTYSDSYMFLSYEIPSEYTRSGTSSTPSYDSPDGGYSLSVDVEQSEFEILSVEDMLNNRLRSDKSSEVTVLDDVSIDGMVAKQYRTHYTDFDFDTLSVSFVYNDNLITFTALSYNDNIPDDVISDFNAFIESVTIE